MAALPGTSATREPAPPPGGLRPLDTASLRERARDVIRASIVSGDLAPEVTHTVASLSSRLGVSATPVREALFDLGSEGMVEVLPKRGFRVPRLSDQDLDEITALRLMLEVPPVAGLATRDLDGQTAGLYGLAARTEAAARDGAIVDFLTTDKTFHMALLRLHGNARLLELVGRLRDQTRLYGLSELQASGQLVASGAEHARILQAIEGRDPAEVTRRMERHLGHIRGVWAGRSEDES